MIPEHSAAGRNTFLGLFIITLATLMYEVLLTRIFSVTMWYHFAFMAISVVMFGMTLGAMAVYLLPERFRPERVTSQLADSALAFSVSSLLCFLIHLCIPFRPGLDFMRLFSTTLVFVVICIPFIFSGLGVCLALTRFPTQISRMYAADLAGAALGCIALVFVLNATDALTAVVLVAALSGSASYFFAREARDQRRQRRALAAFMGLAVLMAVNSVTASLQHPLLHVVYVRGQEPEDPVYQKWNSYSYLRLHGNPDRPAESPFGWGLSPLCPPSPPVQQLSLTIDASAVTPLTHFTGDLRPLGFLRCDVVNIAHYLRSGANVMVMGAGGGRDMLSALVFDQERVTAVEMNDDILFITNQIYGDFTGHLDRDPRVRLVNDEARSYLARGEEKFDLIQVSFIDTWAATAKGAYALSENSLYTVEAWEQFLGRLTPDGVLTFSRWYYKDRPGEVYRLAALAAEALRRGGVASPRSHVVIVRSMWGAGGKKVFNGAGTIIVGKRPLSTEELDQLDRVCEEMGFEVMVSPRKFQDHVFTRILSEPDLGPLSRELKINIKPPTDNQPFFFNLIRLRDVFNPDLWTQASISYNVMANAILLSLFAILVLLTTGCIFVPLWVRSRGKDLRGASRLLAYFSAIGLGFMMIEIALLQRLIVFLGHPVYGLAVVLFSLLLASGIGSLSTMNDNLETKPGAARLRLILVPVSLIAFALAAPAILAAFQSSTTPVRIIVAVLAIAPLGVFMGMAFPLGMKLAAARSDSLTPWLWGINGAVSVCASALAMVVILASGINAAFATGLLVYAVAAVFFFLEQKKQYSR